MEWLWAALAGCVVVVVTGFNGPLRRCAERVGRKVFREKPVDVRVDWDQANIWAGYLPWVGFANYFPGDLPAEEPPQDGKQWSRWADHNGGYDLRLTMLVVTVVARTDVTVVLETPRVKAVRKDVPEGVGVLWSPAGGGNISPRRYDIDLSADDSPRVYYHGNEGARPEREPQPAPSWKLAAGDVEKLHIWATAEDDKMYEWTMELPLLVDGRRVLIPVDRDGKPFITVGENHPHRYLWRSDDEWFSRRPRQNPLRNPSDRAAPS
jgi:hypothetical protein